METNLVKNAVAADGYPVIRHVGTNGVYRIKELIKTKVNGSWEWSAIYYGRSGKYCRMINDFGNFEYLYNEEIIQEREMDITVKENKKLLPCPFCDSDNLTTLPYYDQCVVHCNDCQCDGPEGDMPTCERLWNERAD